MIEFINDIPSNFTNYKKNTKKFFLTPVKFGCTTFRNSERETDNATTQTQTHKKTGKKKEKKFPINYRKKHRDLCLHILSTEDKEYTRCRPNEAIDLNNFVSSQRDKLSLFNKSQSKNIFNKSIQKMNHRVRMLKTMCECVFPTLKKEQISLRKDKPKLTYRSRNLNCIPGYLYVKSLYTLSSDKTVNINKSHREGFQTINFGRRNKYKI